MPSCRSFSRSGSRRLSQKIFTQLQLRACYERGKVFERLDFESGFGIVWRIKNIILFILIAATGVFGIWQTTIGVNAAIEAWQSVNWPTAPGQIVSSSVVVTKSTARHGNSYSYRPVITYNYTVKGTIFTSSEITPGRTWGTESSYKIVSTFPAGSSAPVYYSPDDPHEGLLLPGLHAYNFGGLGFGMMACTVAGLLAVIFLWLPNRERTSTDGSTSLAKTLGVPILIVLIVALLLEFGGMIWLASL